MTTWPKCRPTCSLPHLPASPPPCFPTSPLPCFPASLLPRLGAVALTHDAALEQPAPFRADRSRIPEEFFIHGLGEARVGRLEHVRIHEPSLDGEDVER
jgi:hypothetical protein